MFKIHPISLLSSVSKIFDRVILNRLVFFLERNNLIIPTQFDFHHNYSTTHLIFDIIIESYQKLIINVSLLSSFVILKKHLILSVTKYLCAAETLEDIFQRELWLRSGVQILRSAISFVNT